MFLLLQAMFYISSPCVRGWDTRSVFSDLFIAFITSYQRKQCFIWWRILTRAIWSLDGWDIELVICICDGSQCEGEQHSGLAHWCSFMSKFFSFTKEAHPFNQRHKSSFLWAYKPTTVNLVTGVHCFPLQCVCFPQVWLLWTWNKLVKLISVLAFGSCTALEV